jgi:hypothetical protein
VIARLIVEDERTAGSDQDDHFDLLPPTERMVARPALATLLTVVAARLRTRLRRGQRTGDSADDKNPPMSR